MERLLTISLDQRLLTVEMEASNSWLVQPIHAAYDLDNLKLVDVKEKQVLFFFHSKRTKILIFDFF